MAKYVDDEAEFSRVSVDAKHAHFHQYPTAFISSDQLIQFGAGITRSIFWQIFTKYNPYLSRHVLSFCIQHQIDILLRFLLLFM